MRNLVWLKNVDGVYLVNVCWLPVGQQDSRDFVIHRALSPIGWEDLQIVCQLKEKLPVECHQQANYCLSVTIRLTKLGVSIKGAAWLSRVLQRGSVRVQPGSVRCSVAQ